MGFGLGDFWCPNHASGGSKAADGNSGVGLRERWRKSGGELAFFAVFLLVCRIRRRDGRRKFLLLLPMEESGRFCAPSLLRFCFVLLGCTSDAESFGRREDRCELCACPNWRESPTKRDQIRQAKYQTGFWLSAQLRFVMVSRVNEYFQRN